MKTNTILIIGGSIAAGTTAFILYKYFNSRIKETAKVPKTANTENVTEINNYQQEILEVKQDVASAVDNRHKEAATVIRESLGNIFNSTTDTDVIDSEDEGINQANEELDRLLD